MYEMILKEMLKCTEDPHLGIILTLSQIETLAEIAADVAQDILLEKINIKMEKIICILEE